MTGRDREWRRRFGWVVLFLAGPVVWYVHFWVVYLLAEGGCVLGREAFAPPSLTWLTVVVLATTAVAVAVIGWFTWQAWRWWRRPADEGDQFRAHFSFIGFLLGLLFMIATLFVGLPAAVLAPC